MTQIFADGEQLGGVGPDPDAVQAPTWPMVRQRSATSDLTDLVTASIDPCGPALTAGKGVRPVRCVGCGAQGTLPHPDDDGSLCARCGDTLAGTGPRSAPSGRWRSRWFTGT